MKEPRRRIETEQHISNRLEAEQRLWVGVIVQAINDATEPFAYYRREARNEAREWLSKPSRDLAYVCELADTNMDRLIAFAKQKIAETDKRDEATKPVQRGRVITFDGKSMTINEWAAHLSVDSNTLRWRLNQGHPLEYALTGNYQRGVETNTRRNKRGFVITKRSAAPSIVLAFNGTELTLTEWASRLGIEYSTLRERIERGLPFIAGGGSELASDAKGPAGVHDARLTQIRDFEPEKA